MPVTGPTYPVNLLLGGQRCLVVGGGAVATHKARGLLAAGAVVHLVAPEVGAEARDLPITWEERAYRSPDLDGVRLVVSATGDGVTDAQVFRDAEAAGVLVNSADDPEHCRCTLPSVVRRGDLQVAISTGGRSPALSAWLRERFEDELGPEYEALLEVLAEERERLRGEGIATEGLDWRGALASGMLEMVRQGHVSEAKERLRACLSSSSD